MRALVEVVVVVGGGRGVWVIVCVWELERNKERGRENDKIGFLQSDMASKNTVWSYSLYKVGICLPYRNKPDLYQISNARINLHTHNIHTHTVFSKKLRLAEQGHPTKCVIEKEWNNSYG